MPALNEAETVAEVIARIPPRIDGVSTVEVLVIDDGSTDATAERARQAGAEVISHSPTRGVGAAFHTALDCATQRPVDLLVTIDADGQFDPERIAQLIEPLLAGRADFVTASRFKDPALTPQMPWIKRWGNRMMSRLISRIAGQRFCDVSCGMRASDRRAMMHLNLMGTFTYTQEVFLNLAFKGLRIAEVPLAVRGQRAHGDSRVAGNLWRYGLRTLGIIFRCYRDYRPMRFFGWLALAMILPALALGVFLAVHYLRTGSFTPHKWAGFTGAALMLLGLLLVLGALVGDMLNRHRIYLEELLYYARQDKPGRNGRDGQGDGRA